MKALPEEETNERRLVEAAQKDPRRFADLYESNFERVYAYIARRVGDRDQAQDLTAEVFHQALANLSRFEWRGVPFTAWLFRIASNAIADHWKRAGKEGGSPAPMELASSEASPETIEDSARLFRLARTLPANQCRVIEMRFAQEKSIREIAHELNLTQGAVKQLQFRALGNLRREFTNKSSKKASPMGTRPGERNG